MQGNAIYKSAFEGSLSQAPFLIWHYQDEEGLQEKSWSRSAFLTESLKITHCLYKKGACRGDAVTLLMKSNRPEDLFFRLAARILGLIPVTINWHADDLETICFKIEASGAQFVFLDPDFDDLILNQILARFPDLKVIESQSYGEDLFTGAWSEIQEEDTCMVIFTSGTTGKPKGVELSYKNYACNQSTFESFLEVKEKDALHLICVNPLHHTNSSAMTDWAMRRVGTRLHLIQIYRSGYWETLVQIEKQSEGKIIAPVVALHFDYLENLDNQGKLMVPRKQILASFSKICFLMGSAPVGPETVKRMVRYTGRSPVVRFGSTETCLQVAGTDIRMAESEKMDCFKRGWEHEWGGEKQVGYWIGQAHPPFTNVNVVKSVSEGNEGFMQSCQEGEPGYAVVRGDNCMKQYVNNLNATQSVYADTWYTGLGDIVFYLMSEQHQAHLYWLSRESNLLIRGGANYSCERIAADLKSLVMSAYSLKSEDFYLAVVAMRMHSEHDDDCIVVMELKSDLAKTRQEEIRCTLKDKARTLPCKAGRPDEIVFEKIPKNFKGAVQVKDLRCLVQKRLKLEGI